MVVVQEPAEHERSGADAAEAVRTASAGTPHAGVQAPVETTEPHAAPVEQVRDDPAMTRGRVVTGGGPEGTATTPSGPDPARAGSGGAQSVVGARVSDRLSAGEDVAGAGGAVGSPTGPPTDDDA